jgi:hypothetical protein
LFVFLVCFCFVSLFLYVFICFVYVFCRFPICLYMVFGLIDWHVVRRRGAARRPAVASPVRLQTPQAAATVAASTEALVVRPTPFPAAEVEAPVRKVLVVPAVSVASGLTPQVSPMALPVVMPVPVATVGPVVTGAVLQSTPPVAVPVVRVGVQEPPGTARPARPGPYRCAMVVPAVPAVRVVTAAVLAPVERAALRPLRLVGRPVPAAPRAGPSLGVPAVPAVPVALGLTPQVSPMALLAVMPVPVAPVGPAVPGAAMQSTPPVVVPVVSVGVQEPPGTARPALPGPHLYAMAVPAVPAVTVETPVTLAPAEPAALRPRRPAGRPV